MTIKKTFLTLSLLVTGIHSAEWLTSSGYFCTERCQAKNHSLGNNVVGNVLMCPVVDGVELEHKPGISSAGQDLSEDDKYKWDYCSPAQIETIATDYEDYEDGEGMDVVPLPPQEENLANYYDYNPGSDPFDNSMVVVNSSIDGVQCEGECSRATNSEQYKCDISYKGMTNFYCSPDSPLYRQQLSSKHKLWCLSPCTKPDIKSNFMCRTMFGLDLCSPNSGLTTSGSKCFGTCRVDQGQYKCFVDSARTTLENCSPMVSDLPDDTVTHALDFSNKGKVCAGRCDNQMCNVVSWGWNENERKAELILSLETCGAEGASSNWITIGIVIGCSLAAFAIIIIVTIVFVKNKYSSVNTQDNP